MEFGAWGTDIGYCARDGALLHLILDCSHSLEDGGGGVSGKKKNERKASRKESEREGGKIKQATGLAHRLARAINQCSTASRFVSSLALMP